MASALHFPLPHFGRRQRAFGRASSLADCIGECKQIRIGWTRRYDLAGKPEHRPSQRCAETLGVALTEVVRVGLRPEREGPHHDLLVGVDIGQRACRGAAARGA